MHSTVRHYSVISALSLALILGFSLVSNAYALFPPIGQIGSVGNSFQQDKQGEDDNENDNHGNGNKHSSNNSSGEDDEKNDDNKGKNGDHGNNGHGKKLKLRSESNEGGKVKPHEDENDNEDEDQQNSLNTSNETNEDTQDTESFPSDFLLEATDGIALQKGLGKSSASSQDEVSLDLSATTIRLEGNHVRVAVDGSVNLGEAEFKISDGNGIIIFFKNPGKNFFRGIIHITGMAIDSDGRDFKFHMRAFLIPSDDGNDDGSWNFVVAPAAKLGPQIRIVSLVGELTQVGDNGGSQPPANQSLDHFVVSNVPSVEAGKLFNVTVTAKDKDDKTIKNFAGNVEVSDKTGTVKPLLIKNFKDGVFAGKLNITKAMQSDKLTFTDSATGKIGLSNNFDVLVGGIAEVQLIPSSVSVQAGHSANFTATLMDKFDNKISPLGKTFAWSLSSSNFGTITTILNKANFTASSSVSSEEAVTLTVKVAVGNSFVQDNSKITINPLAPTPSGLDHFVIDNISNQKAGVAFPLKITASDSANHTVTSYQGTIVVNDTTATLHIVTNDGFSSGVWTGTVKITKADEDVKVTAKDHDSPSKGGSSNEFDVTAAALAKFTVTGIQVNQTAGEEFSLDVTALDQFDNIVTNYNGTVTLSSNDGNSPAGNQSFVSQNPYVFVSGTDKGKHSFDATLYNAKSNVTIAVTGSGKDGTSIKFNVKHAAVKSIDISPDSVSRVIGGNATFTAEAKDAYGNEVPASDAGFTWELSSGSLGSLDKTTGPEVKFTATLDSLLDPLLGSITVSSGAIEASANITVTPT